LELNEKDKDGTYPLLLILCNDNDSDSNKGKVLQLLIKYTNENNIILKVNEENNGWSPFL